MTFSELKRLARRLGVARVMFARPTEPDSPLGQYLSVRDYPLVILHCTWKLSSQAITGLLRVIRNRGPVIILSTWAKPAWVLAHELGHRMIELSGLPLSDRMSPRLLRDARRLWFPAESSEEITAEAIGRYLTDRELTPKLYALAESIVRRVLADRERQEQQIAVLRAYVKRPQ